MELSKRKTQWSMFIVFLVILIKLSIEAIAEKGYMNNRNMNAPFLLGYGLVVLFLYFVLGTPANPVKWGLLRKTYSKKRQYIVLYINTHKYWFCNYDNLFYGGMLYAFDELDNPIAFNLLRGISVGLMVIMISDFLISFYHMIVEKDFYLKWKIVVRDNREMTKI